MSFWRNLFSFDGEDNSNNGGYYGEGTSNNEAYPHVNYYAGAGYNEYGGNVIDDHNDGQNIGGNKDITDDDDVPNLYQTTKVLLYYIVICYHTCNIIIV